MEIKPYERNAKKHSKEQLYKIACSIRDFGWRQPIVTDKDGVIIVGHGRWFAYERYAKEMSLHEPRVEVASDLTPEQVQVYRLADNLVVSTEYDMDIVNAELAAVSLEFEPYQAMLSFDVLEETKKTGLDPLNLDNPDGYLDYLNNAIRQLVLHYSLEEFLVINEKATQLIGKYKLENMSELFKKLVDEA